MRLYFDAESYLKPSKQSGSLQSRIFSDSFKSSPKQVYALVYSTLKYRPYIQQIIKKSKIETTPSIKKLRISRELLEMLVHDLCFSARGRINSGNHPIKTAFLENKTRLIAEFTKLKLKYKVKDVSELPVEEDNDETPIRWFRINTIKCNPDDFFNTHSWFAKLQPVNSISDIKDCGMIYQDDYIPNLYGIHPKEKLTSTDAYKLGQVIIQDRASCFPAHILNSNDHHIEVIDACAAPGNKTTHAAAYLDPEKKSVVYAFERDVKRAQILKKMCETATGKQDLIHITRADFTSIDPLDFPEVTGLIVDPSCSGSGIFGRALEDSFNDTVDGEIVDKERLNRLAGFQFSIVKHAMSFPKARKVVYSTCSIHATENEQVVIDLLRDREIFERGWKLAPRDLVIPNWERRGWEQEFSSIAYSNEECIKLAGGCVRANPKEDGGIGFFAACFIRGDQYEAESNAEVEQEVHQEQEQEDEEEEWAGFE
ncbi:25S rRNA [Spathaspora sp. JA1]|nr:25S rRNA [Spathaspora sp. JA1]